MSKKLMNYNKELLWFLSQILFCVTHRKIQFLRHSTEAYQQNVYVPFFIENINVDALYSEDFSLNKMKPINLCK